VSISSDGDIDSPKLDGEYYSELDPDVDMGMEDDADAPEGIDLDGNVDMEWDCEDEEEEEEKKKEEEDEVDEVDEHEEEDKNEDDGKEPRTIGQGKMLNTSTDDVGTMVNDQPIELPEYGQEMCEHTPLPQPPVPSPRPQNQDPHTRP